MQPRFLLASFPPLPLEFSSREGQGIYMYMPIGTPTYICDIVPTVRGWREDKQNKLSRVNASKSFEVLVQKR